MDSKGIALVTFDEKGTPTAFRHTLSQAETCGRDVTGGSLHSWRLKGAEIGPDVSGDRLIFIDLDADGDNRCGPHSLQLRREAFQPAKVEKNGRPTHTRPTILEGEEVIPPQKK